MRRLENQFCVLRRAGIKATDIYLGWQLAESYNCDAYARLAFAIGADVCFHAQGLLRRLAVR